MILLIVAGWVACGVLAAGFTYAHFQRKNVRDADAYRTPDVWFAVLMGALGPCGLATALVMRDTAHGWLLPGRKP